jgi:hypothetical protein
MNRCLPSHRRRRVPAGLLVLLLAPAALAQTSPAGNGTTPVTEIAPVTVTSPSAEMSPIRTTFGQFVDDLPGLLNFTLPALGPDGLFRFYVRPRFGDLARRSYMRIPFGVRAKVTKETELSAEMQGYFTHGLRSGSAGDGLSGLLVGAKHEQSFAGSPDAAWSAGMNFVTPLSRPPLELTDGFRHTLPYVGATYTLLPKWRVVGFNTLAADLLDHTALPQMFGRNQLHGNALSFEAGVARDWKTFRLSLATNYATTAGLTNENNHVFGVRPNLLIPIKPLAGSRLRLMFNVGGRAIWGPDGREVGVSSSLSVVFDIKTK